jgi:hypothetical protein
MLKPRLRPRWGLRRRTQRGSVAIMFALMSVMLLTVAALGTDIGNAAARHTTVQTQADFGAFAAAEQMTTNGSAGQTVPSTVVNAVVTALNNNQPEDDAASKATCMRSGNHTCVTAAQLTDGNLNNGEVRYTSLGLQVVAPRNFVSFGMARVIGINGTNVYANATVNIFSPGLRELPMFAVQGCDYGLQTLADPSNGHDPAVAPPLAFNTEPTPANANQTALVTGSVILKDNTGAQVNSLAPNTSGNTVTFQASKFQNSYQVGFFRGDDTTPSLVQTAVLPGANPGSNNGFSSNPTTSVTVTVPLAVTQTSTIWWIRVYDDSGTDKGSNPITTPHTGQWSPVTQALPMRVGNAVLQCASGSNDGNFGTLKLPRTDVQTSADLPVNIAAGLQSPLSLVTANPGDVQSTGQCTDGVNNAITSPGSLGTLVPRTNCVGTDTGLAANVATQGFITGSSGYQGLLTRQNTKSGCDPTGGSANRLVTINNTQYSLNNDTLTCYFTNGTTSIQDIAQASYTGPAVLDPSIIDSPRFVLVPVLKVQPGNGSSNNYSIIDVRPGFITDETANSSTVQGTHTADSDNGLTISNNGITQLKVVFFSLWALPTDNVKDVIDYLGVGPRIVRLVN